MSRTNAGKLVLAAKSSGTAVGAFNVILLEHAEALVAGAEHAKLPVIMPRAKI
jgi:fructose/tagatose bisphosphate aldolase